MQNKKRPWPRGKPMACDVTVTDTYAQSHIGDTATKAGAAVNQAETNKTAKYGELASMHIFYPVAIVTGGTWNHWAVELVQEIQRRINHWRTQRIHLSVSAVVNSPPKGKCGRFLNTNDSD